MRAAGSRRKESRRRANLLFMPEIHFETVHFTGRVQGVGFRYAALQVSREFEVAGWVANLPDGRVQLEVEGDRAAVDRFVTAVEERMHGHIRKTERNAAPRAAQFSGFAIR
ncbi:MAG: hypothetical protein RL324_848 [Verrucomicrobiota bacterium]